MSLPISRSSLNSIPTSFATVSVSTPSDPLEQKLRHISSAGFQAIELGFPYLLYFASAHHKREIQENDYESLCSAGEEVKKLCEKHKLKIMMLQPFSNFEGWKEGSREREDAFERAKVGSTDAPLSSLSPETISSDLASLADLLARHNFCLAYENWCWATLAPTWSTVWDMVQKADRPNISLCLDTFQTAGGEYANPTTKSGLIEHKGTQHKVEMDFMASLALLTRTVPAEKIYLLQISDAYRPPVPFEDKEVGGLRPRRRWSHDFRPYLWNGGRLSEQCVLFAKAVLGTGSRCWFSMEVFDGGQDGNGGMKQYEMGEFCEGAMESYKRLLDECSK